jgi:hypothetical protein
VVLGSCNYINIPCGIFWGVQGFLLFFSFFTHSLIVLGSLVLIQSQLHPSHSSIFGASFFLFRVLLV